VDVEVVFMLDVVASKLAKAAERPQSANSFDFSHLSSANKGRWTY
jgi:hypothetical protein